MPNIELTERAARYLALVAIERIGNDLIVHRHRLDTASLERMGNRLIDLAGELGEKDPELPLVQILRDPESPPWLI